MTKGKTMQSSFPGFLSLFWKKQFMGFLPKILADAELHRSVCVEDLCRLTHLHKFTLYEEFTFYTPVHFSQE